jgi:hypothetical protein
VHDANGDPVEIEHETVIDTGVVGHARSVAPSRHHVSVPPTADDGGHPLETVEHLEHMHVACMDDEIATAEGLVGLRGQVGPRLGDVGVCDEPDAHRDEATWWISRGDQCRCG